MRSPANNMEGGGYMLHPDIEKKGLFNSSCPKCKKSREEDDRELANLSEYWGCSGGLVVVMLFIIIGKKKS
jgi:hypothetical protein